MSFYPSSFYGYAPEGLIASASHITSGENPPYAVSDFLEMYPQFQGKVNDFVLAQFIAMANAVVLQVRWHESWVVGMGAFVAHFAALYLRSLGGDDPTAKQVIAAAQAKGLQTSKSVGSVSVSYDFSSISDDFKGWGKFRDTEFGQLFITLAKPLAVGGSYIW